MRYYELVDDMTIPGRWLLGTTCDADGAQVDPFRFLRGGPVAHPGTLRLPVSLAGRALDFSLADFGVPVARPWVGDVLEDLAPGCVQRFPVRVDGTDDAFEVLNVVATARCVDEPRTEYVLRWTEADGRPKKTGTYRALMGMRVLPAAIAPRHLVRVEGWTVAMVASEAVRAGLAGALGPRFIDAT